MKQIKYYYSVASPFAYLAIDRFSDLVKKYKIQVIEKPVDLVGKIFTQTGGVPVPQRHISRQKYRLLEISRFGQKHKVKINVQPKFFPPKDPHLAALFTISAIHKGNSLTFGKKILELLWSKEKDISEINNIRDVCSELNFNFDELHELSKSEKIKSIYNQNCLDAVSDGVFGAPTYIYNNEMFWGQDRVDLLEEAIAK
jgi:2-hydroxychromene-2-carboxylate isomerase